jgi:hypothetical protein
MTEKFLWGAKFLKDEQQNHGGFLGLSSPDKNNFKKVKKYDLTFPSSLILESLNSISNDNIFIELKNKLTNFLLNQKSPNWSLNYFTREPVINSSNSYPDDLDATFCALAGLHLTNPNILDGEAYAKISLILTAFETQEGGPYKTWIVPEEASNEWKDVDLAVNCNIAYFLKTQDIILPNIDKLIEEAIISNKLTSPYYSDEFPVYYFVSRAYNGSLQHQLCDIILSNQLTDGSFGNPLHTSFALTALLRSGHAPEGLKSTYEWLYSLSDSDIAKPYSFGIDPAIEGQTHYAGSAAVTVTFYLEALSEYEKFSNITLTKSETEPVASNQTLDIYQKTIQAASQKANSAGSELGKQMHLVLQKIQMRDKDGQIILMPYLFNKCLGDLGLTDSNPILTDLCLANLFGWIAYTIYDDFLDDEGKPILLSLANFCLRETSVIFTNIEKRYPEFKYIWTKVMNDLDEANTKEIQAYRFEIKNNTFIIPNPLPNTVNDEMRYNRSMGHALGPVAILCALGKKIPNAEIQNTLSFFRAYIAARQLNDDAHDWEGDLNQGHLNETVIDLLTEWQNSSLNTSINLEKDILELQKLFWMKVINYIIDKANQHITDARASLNNITIIQNKQPLTDLLDSIQASTDLAKKEQTDMLTFLKVYQNSETNC